MALFSVSIVATPTPVFIAPAPAQELTAMAAAPPIEQPFRAPPAVPAAPPAKAPVPEVITAPAAAQTLMPPSKPVASTSPRNNHAEKCKERLGYSTIDRETSMINICATRHYIREQHDVSREAPYPPRALGAIDCSKKAKRKMRLVSSIECE